MYKNKSGFTLIELMIVIAMIATLTTMALPSFQDRIIRTQVQEALHLAVIAREGVDAFYKKHGRLPVSNQEAGLPAAEKIIGNFTSSVEVVDGAVHVTLGKKINRHAQGMIVSLRPAIVQGESRVPIAWVCGQGSVPEGMVSTVINETTLPSRLLPIECRY